MKKKIRIKSFSGLHARPATLITKAASKCSEDVFLTAKGKTITAKSVISILMLSLSSGEELEVDSDNEWVFDEIEKILSSQEYEEAELEVIQKKPRNLEKFIQKRIKNSDQKIFFSTKTFSEAIAENTEKGQIIDSEKILKIKKTWCIDGTVPALIHALGVSPKNKLEIFSLM